MTFAIWLVRVVVSTILATIGWWLGATIGIFTAYLLSTVAGGYGLWLGGRIARDHLGLG
jgi:hypothetical protein